MRKFIFLLSFSLAQLTGNISTTTSSLSAAVRSTASSAPLPTVVADRPSSTSAILPISTTTSSFTLTATNTIPASQSSGPSLSPSPSESVIFLTPTSSPTTTTLASSSDSGISPVLISFIVIVCLILVILICFYGYKTISFIDRNRKIGKKDNQINFTDALEETTNHSTFNRKYPIFAVPYSTSEYLDLGQEPNDLHEYDLKDSSNVYYSDASIPHTDYFDEDGNPIYYFDQNGQAFTTEEYYHYYSEPLQTESGVLGAPEIQSSHDLPSIVEVHRDFSNS